MTVKKTAGMMLTMFLLVNSSYLYSDDGCDCVDNWNSNNQAWLKSNSISFEIGP